MVELPLSLPCSSVGTFLGGAEWQIMPTWSMMGDFPFSATTPTVVCPRGGVCGKSSEGHAEWLVLLYRSKADWLGRSCVLGFNL